MTYAIEARRLAKHFPGQNGRKALYELDLTVPQGEMYALVGPDGAGKTTTLRILSTVMSQTSGEAFVNGYDVRRQADRALSFIGYMPQNFSLYPDLSVLENLHFFADVQGVSVERRKERIPEMLAFTRLTPFQSRRSVNLSGGMKKKLALACALMHEPEVLLLDEPSTGVDPVSRRELWQILSKVTQEGVTIVVSTPYMDEAERCTRVGMLYQGRLLTTGTPQSLIANVPYDIVEVKAKPRKAMRQVVRETEGIQSWRPVGDRLRLAVTDPRKVIRSLRRAFRAGGLTVKLLRATRPGMEDVFVHMVEGQADPA